MAQKIQASDAVEWLFCNLSDLRANAQKGVPLIVGIGAPSAAGKGYLTERLTDLLGKTTIVSLDSFYKGRKWMEGNNINSFDDPRSLDLNGAATAITILKYGHSASVPRYDFTTGQSEGSQVLDPTPIIIVEGLFALMSPVLETLDYKVFVSTDPHSSLLRRILRDAGRSGRTKQTSREVLFQFFKEVLPSTISFINPTSEAADLIVESEFDAEHEASRANVFESQLKISGHPDLEMLQEIGAHRICKTTQKDIYLAPKDRSITGEIVRLRYESGSILFTYKGPFFGGLGTLAHSRAKREFELYQREAQLLSDAYEEICSISKVRTVYGWMGFEIALDEVEDLGQFTEVRSVLPGNVRTLDSAISELGFLTEENKSFLKSYLDLYLETRKKIPR